MKVTGAQIRAARAMLRWSIIQLAERAGVGVSTVQALEAHDGTTRRDDNLKWRVDARRESLEKVVSTMTAAGITFLATNQDGVGVRSKSPPSD